MDQFVGQAAEVGTSDSSGSFTVNPARAREEMREFQLARSGSYIGKIVQAANRSGADTVQVKASRTELTVEFCSPDPELNNPDSVLEALLAGHSLSESPLRHLVVGLNAATASDLAEVRWETSRGSVVLTEKDIRKGDQNSVALRFVARKHRTLSRWFLGTVYLEELDFLSRYCCYGRCELTIDNRPVSTLRWDHFAPEIDQLGVDSDERKCSLLDVLEPGDSGLWLAPPAIWTNEPAKDDEWQKARKRERRALLYRGPQTDCRVPVGKALSVRPALRGAGQLFCVKDGVLMDPIETDLGHPGVVLMVPADELKTDLSEFQIVQDGHFYQQVALWRRWVRQQTEAVTSDQVPSLLRKSQLSEPEPGVLQNVTYWFANHCLPEVKTLDELVAQWFADKLVVKSPSEADHRVAAVRKLHKDHLPKDERLLALYDDTLTGSGKLGFAITEKRLCWKNALSGAEYLLWQNLDPSTVRLEKGRVFMMQGEVVITMSDSVKACLSGFLRAVAQLDVPRAFDLPPEQNRILRLALHHLGKRPGVHYYPHIPLNKLSAAAQAYSEPLPNDQTALLLYDDNLFGGGDTGFIVTDTTLYWRNILSESRSAPLSEISRCSFTRTGTGIKIDEEELMICHEELKAPVLRFLAEVGLPEQLPL